MKIKGSPNDNNGNFLETDIFTWRIFYENVNVELVLEWLENSEKVQKYFFWNINFIWGKKLNFDVFFVDGKI